jgi:hypothetical protein
MKRAMLIVLLCSAAPFLSPTILQADADTAAHSEWVEKYQEKLNRKYTDEEKGIVGFEIDGDVIYVSVNEEVCSCSFLSLAMQWAKRFYEDREKHAAGEVLARIVRDGATLTEIGYDGEKYR